MGAGRGTLERSRMKRLDEYAMPIFVGVMTLAVFGGLYLANNAPPWAVKVWLGLLAAPFLGIAVRDVWRRGSFSVNPSGLVWLALFLGSIKLLLWLEVPPAWALGLPLGAVLLLVLAGNPHPGEEYDIGP